MELWRRHIQSIHREIADAHGIMTMTGEYKTTMNRVAVRTAVAFAIPVPDGAFLTLMTTMV